MIDSDAADGHAGSQPDRRPAGSPEPRGGVILLAAGRSRRFGGDKRAHRLADGLTLLGHSLVLQTRVFGDCILVLRPDDLDPPCPPALTRPPAIVRADDADLGMGHSLAAGAEAARASGWDYLFVALADMPWIAAATLQCLRDALVSACRTGDAAIVLPVRQGTPGHPVGFTADFLPELCALTGDTGARPVVQAHPEAIRRFPVDDPGICQDIDTPEQAR